MSAPTRDQLRDCISDLAWLERRLQSAEWHAGQRLLPDDVLQTMAETASDCRAMVRAIERRWGLLP